MAEKRYLKNVIISDKEQEVLAEKKAAIIGLGGLGGYVAEMAARLGIGCILLCDGDEFETSNLNRQILSTEHNLNENKAEVAAERIFQINSELKVEIFKEFITEKNGEKMLAGCDIVFDCLDNPKTKLMLKDICCRLEIPMVHGAINGWFGQAAVIYPQDNHLDEVYKGRESDFKEYESPSFTPAVVGGIQIAEGLKVLLERGNILNNEILFIDLLNSEIEKVKF